MSNIELVNKTIANKLNISEDKVKQVNNFYWQTIKKLGNTATDQTIPIMFIGTLKPSVPLIEKRLLQMLKKCRTMKKRLVRQPTNAIHLMMIQKMYEAIRTLWKLRYKIKNDNKNWGISKVATSRAKKCRTSD